MINDNEVDMVRYMHPNRGQHPVYGPATKKFYGMRSGGGKETFLVQRQDIVSAPQFFQIVSPIPTAPPVPILAPPPPPVMVQAPAPVPQMREVPPPPVMMQAPPTAVRDARPEVAQTTLPPNPEDTTPEIIPNPPGTGYTEEEILREYPEGSVINEDGNVEIPQNPNPMMRALENARFDLQLLPGATPGIIKGMADAGLNTVEAILAGGVEQIRGIKGVGPVRAAMIYGYVFQNFGGGA